jgi:hypothetical protein
VPKEATVFTRTARYHMQDQVNNRVRMITRGEDGRRRRSLTVLPLLVVAAATSALFELLRGAAQP